MLEVDKVLYWVMMTALSAEWSECLNTIREIKDFIQFSKWIRPGMASNQSREDNCVAIWLKEVNINSRLDRA